MFGLTGSPLVYKEAYWRLTYPELRIGDVELPAERHAEALATAQRQFGDAVRSFKFPEPGVPAYHLYLESGEAFLAPDDLRVIDQWSSRERPMAVLFDLHAHLMAGETGELIGGVIALFAVFLVVSGLVLWWPTRRHFRVSSLIPREMSRRALLISHRDLGAAATPLLLVLLLSGAGLVFYAAAQKLLNGALGDEVPSLPVLSGPADLSGVMADAAVLEAAQAAFPLARLVFYYPPRDGTTLHEFRVKQPCELHPNGRSYVYLAGDGSVLGKVDACAHPPGERAVQAFYPLHSGKTESGIYKFLTFLGGVALALLSATGALSFAKRLLRPAREA
jgi:uncharacterized iron-regulated membrane protein